MYETDQLPVTLSEIHNQVQSCQKTLGIGDARNGIFARFLPLENYTDIVITGCGSSLHVATCASFAWSGMLQRPVIAVASSELAHFPEHYLAPTARPLVIAISRSGGTSEVKLAVKRLQRDYRALALAITTDAGSVAEVCDEEIVFEECREKSVVMTQAFVCMLAGLYLLGDGASGRRYASEINKLPMLVRRAIQLTESVVRSLAEDPQIDRFFFLGSGPMKAVADECALKLTEMALDTAFSYGTLEFRHGPKATLDPADQVVIFPVEAEHPYLETLLTEIEITEARVLVIEHASLLSAYESGRASRGTDQRFLGIPGTLPELFRPALYAHIGQFLAFWRAVARNLNPDAPRHLERTVLLNG